jgi:hypothetical protein
MTGKAWIIGILGLWLIVASFLTLGQAGNLWNDLTVGVILAVLAFSMTRDRPGQGWIAGVLGLWTIVAAFIPGLHHGAGLFWNNIPVGVVVALAGFTALAGAAQRHVQPREQPHTP